MHTYELKLEEKIEGCKNCPIGLLERCLLTNRKAAEEGKRDDCPVKEVKVW